MSAGNTDSNLTPSDDISTSITGFPKGNSAGNIDSNLTPSNDVSTSTAACLKVNSAGKRIREPIETKVIDVSVMDHYYMRNYDSSSGGMESEGLLLIMLNL